MGVCFSADIKVTGGSRRSGGATASEKQAEGPRNEAASEQPPQKERGEKKRSVGLVPCGKRTDFGYAKDFENRYSIGKLLGHGQFGYTFVATEKATGERVAVKRIDKNKVNLQTCVLTFVPSVFCFFFFFFFPSFFSDEKCTSYTIRVCEKTGRIDFEFVIASLFEYNSVTC
ncbi:calcium-dependent protein kinase 28-like [Zingiber officinale]|uniref:calcium-dependent protein kinase 28-like n=1 Tax=Zingiber officinale TaxID=94328 RepID=UPI001C4CB5D3|nr:calcium-dependent protein kinase 28-like [Zingiber officinale]